MTTLIIQIPSFNEEGTLKQTISELPSHIDGIDSIKILVIDDGSTDATSAVAKESGADYIVTHKHNMGLASAFMTGLSACASLQADIIVNTDADNQYNAEDIVKLVKPIQEKKADIVIGARPISEIEEFSRIKKILQRFGSWTIRKISDTDIPDAPSGFRAFSREAAIRLNVFSRYTYTLETIIQAGLKNMSITSVPIRVNPGKRESRLIKSIPDYIGKSAATALRIFMIYRPLAFFTTLGLMALIAGTLLGLRFMLLFLQGSGDGHIQSLILASILISLGFQTIITGIQADLIAVNRELLEQINERQLLSSSSKYGVITIDSTAQKHGSTSNHLEHALWQKQ